MSIAEYPSISLHNVAETVPAEWNPEGDRLRRVPASVDEGLNDSARERVGEPTGCEIRFVPEGDAEIEVTLSAPEPTRIHPFWGVFQPWKPTEIGPEPETLSLRVPDRLADLSEGTETGRFDPRVCRLLTERTPAVAVHDVAGECRPPTADELPDTRYLAYGTSITEGAAASTPHTNYVTRVARELGYDALNLGCSGSAYCDRTMADHIAGREDFDVATLSLSVNMANADFSIDEFHSRAETFVETIAAAHPEKPIACVTLLPYFADLTASGDRERSEGFRDALGSIVADSDHDDLHLVSGPDLMEVSGLTADLLHPGDDGMAMIGTALADRLERIVE
ncbi:SGNH/GDSL hydrolase family protein [Saliphagus sp. LR7]|uniref:SGNH/GDSL hydrolase family protein n=1 Tax=Saliphagus sp. LR7 TaxID=2282654 RepID=UPI000DF7439D|nr:SGNH/GDSL hydrolase family protein [Saliphagus sp. LR7]